MGASKPQPPNSPSERVGDRLDSWKEIAAYLRRDERTVRRWEAEGLPVHRKVHKKQASVYAYTAEIDTWWNGGRRDMEETRIRASSSTCPVRETDWRRTVIGRCCG